MNYVEELANRFFISKYYFIRIFKAVINYTVKEYIDKRRITEAVISKKSFKGVVGKPCAFKGFFIIFIE